MGKQPLVVLLGDSVLIESVAVSLGGSRVLGVTRIDTLAANIEECLVSLKPDLVVFELDSPYSPLAFSYLRERSCVQLVGLDLTCSRVIVLDSQQHAMRTMSELAHVVQALFSREARA
jgi:hypothetical protein